MSKQFIITAGTQPATLAEVARHLQVSRQIAQITMSTWCCRVLPGDRYNFSDIWHRMWHINDVPLARLPEMKTPLLTISDVAAMSGASEHTIRRVGNNRDPKWNLPAHVDLGPRARRYLPLHIHAWWHREPLERWLEPQLGPSPGVLGLVARNAKTQQKGGFGMG